MTLVYIPRLIESVEQAEALPIGTLAIRRDGDRILQTLTKTTCRGPGPWDLDMHGYRHESVIGFMALVPVEAEEETFTPLLAGRDGYPGGGSSVAVPLRRLVTPWEDA